MNKRVLVVDEWSATQPGERAAVIGKFSTPEEASTFIGTLPNVEDVEAGRYGIDAPEVMG